MTESRLGTIEMVATSLYVSDLDAATVWYSDKLGLVPVSVAADGHPYAAFVIGGAVVVLEPIEAALEATDLSTGNTTLNVLVDRDPAAVRAELIERDVTCGELVVSPNFVSFLMRDLCGNRFYVARPATDEGRRGLEETAAAMASGAP